MSFSQDKHCDSILKSMAPKVKLELIKISQIYAIYLDTVCLLFSWDGFGRQMREKTPKNETTDFQVRCRSFSFVPLYQCLHQRAPSQHWLNNVYCAGEVDIVFESLHGRQISTIYPESQRGDWEKSHVVQNISHAAFILTTLCSHTVALWMSVC